MKPQLQSPQACEEERHAACAALRQLVQLTPQEFCKVVEQGYCTGEGQITFKIVCPRSCRERSFRGEEDWAIGQQQLTLCTHL